MKKKKSTELIYRGEFYSLKKHAKIAKLSLRRVGYKVKIRKSKPTKKEIQEYKKQHIRYLGFKPKKAPSKIYKIYMKR